MSFVERHGLWSDEQKEAATRLRRIVEEQKLEVIRLSFPDQHGILRGKTLVAERGAGLAGKRLHHHHHDVRQGHLAQHGVSGVHLRRRFRHAGDGRRRRRADGAGSLELPRAAVVAGAPAGCCATSISPTAGRCRSRPAISTVGARKARTSAATISSPGSRSNSTSSSSKTPKMSPEDAGQPGHAARSVSLLSHGYQYLTEQRYDQMEPVLEIIRRDILALGLPLRSIEVEFGPSQCEFTFAPTDGLEPADTMVLFRSAVKQICHRHGYHATFMCRPKTAECVRLRLASASVDRVARQRRERLHEQGRRRGAERRSAAAISPGCCSMPAPRPCSRRRPSTATSAIAPIRWRRIARSGAATTAA